MNKKFLFAATTAALISTSAFAEESQTEQQSSLSESHFQLGYYTSEDVSGLALRSKADLFDSNVYFKFEYGYGQVSNSNMDIGDVDVGLGYRFSIQDNFDINAEVGYLVASASMSGYSTNLNGMRLGVQARYKIIPSVELNAGFDNLAYDDNDSINFFKVGTVYSFSDYFDLVADYKTSENDSISFIGLGLNF